MTAVRAGVVGVTEKTMNKRVYFHFLKFKNFSHHHCYIVLFDKMFSFVDLCILNFVNVLIQIIELLGVQTLSLHWENGSAGKSSLTKHE